MIYLDTSVVVALLTPEDRSALGIKQRHHGLSSAARQAAELLQDPGLGLRAGDALHLAVALHSRCTHLASFDGRMQQAAAALGMRPALESANIPRQGLQRKAELRGHQD
ncbi:MAG: hypothetical protein RLZZ336_871 [Cyanobacteriota bacterium]